MSTVAMYYFQGDLGESLEYPNGFVIPNTAKPTFGTFLKYFPAHEKGVLHFRFRTEDPQHGYVWLDVTNKDETLPFYQDSIMAKVLRVDDAPTIKRKSALRRKNLEQLAANIVTGAAAMFGRPDTQPNKADIRASHQAPRPQPAYSDEPPTRSSAPPAPATAPVKRQGPPAPAPKPAAQAPTPAPAAPAKDILDFEPTTPGGRASPAADASAAAASKPTAAAAATSVDDILDFASAPSPPVSAAPAPPAAPTSTGSASVSNANLAAMMDLDGTPTLSRAELKATRESKINEQVQRAVEEKQELDRKAHQEQEDFDAARAAHDQKLLAWSTNNKERRNIRSLLSTMHTVLWPESRWKPIGLGDLLEPRQVKLQYRKAMLVVHPDHNVNLTNEHKYIAKRVFEAVNEAYNEFTTKETV